MVGKNPHFRNFGSATLLINVPIGPEIAIDPAETLGQSQPAWWRENARHSPMGRNR
jgi:hypothetical protein